MNIDKIIDVTKDISSVAPEAYSDVVHPPAENLGKALATVVDLLNTFLTPIELVNKTVAIKKEKFIEEYKNNTSKIPPEKVCPANFSIIAPMLDHLKFKITEDELRSKYAKLISSASDEECLTKPLLSFDNVLNQLTPYEIQLLEHLFKTVPDKIYPLATIKRSSELGFNILYKYLPGISFKQLSFDVLSVMISNLDRLGIVIIDTDNYVEPANERYKFITESQLFKSLQGQCEIIRKATNKQYPVCSIHKESFALSNFGKSFVDTILS